MTLGEALRKGAREHPERIALVGEGRRFAYAEVDRRVDALALGLARLGIARGDQVALWMSNVPSWVVCWAACARLGAVLVPINTRYKLDEVEYILRQSDARALIMMDRYWSIDFLGMLRTIVPELDASEPGALRCGRLPELRSVVLWNNATADGTLSLDTLIADGARALDGGAKLPDENPADPIVIVYTSGTTGHPKGAVHSHVLLRNVANIVRCMHVEDGDVVLGHMPYYHVAGAFAGICVALMVSGTLVCMPHWVPDEALDTIARERVAIFGGIPTHFIDCLDAQRRRPRDTSSLKSAWIGGAPVTPDVALAVVEELGLDALQAVYGMTETTSMTTLSEFGGPPEILCDNKGRVIGEFEVKVCDPVTGEPRATGDVGEIWVRGHLVMLGYYKDAKATAAAITPEGWFKSGDLGVFDHAGFLKVTGRLKDMFIVGGTNAFPAEIERVLQSHAQIKQAIVVGVPDRRLGEVGYAFVQPHADAAISASEIVAFCKEKMADYKVPRHVELVSAFPQTSTGKIQRHVLAKAARERVQA